MDERHWWIATKLQQTFKSNQISSSNFAEDFLSDQDIVDKINEFIAADGSNKLIFHCQKALQSEERGNIESEKLQASTSAVRLKDLLLDNSISVVFIRTAVGHEIEPSLVEKEAFVLELKSNALSVFASLLNNAYLLLFKARKDWGECIDHDVVEFLMHADRYASTLQEYAAIITIPHHLLKRPNMLMGNELKHSRLVTVNHALIAEYEALVQDWMQTIESLLSESIDERPDVFSGPLSELEIWQRRQRVLLSVADQLKNKECKTVIGILITTKSRVLKKWKVVDAGLTDAINETKDKVKYLESLRRYFDQLNDGNSPSHIANMTIPAIMSAVKQMENISKFYAKIGFLGVIFTKITNQLVMCCKSSISASLTHYNQMSSNNVWDAIESDISQSEEAAQLNTTIEAPVKTKRGAQQQDVIVKQDLLTILNSCLLLHKQYRDQLRHLKDSLGGSHTLQHVPATSLINSAKKYTSPSLGSINMGSIKPPTANLSPSTGSPDKGRMRPVSALSGIITGIAISDEDAIIGYFDLFAQRVHNIIDLIETLRQFSNLKLTSAGLPVLDFKSLPTKSEVGIIDSEKSLEAGEDEKFDNSNEGDESGDGLQYSDEEIESIEEKDVPIETVTKVISRHVDELTSLLKRNLAPEILLGIDGKGKSNFENSYAEFIKNVREAESFITDFIKNTFKLKWKTMKALEILGCFKPVANRLGLRPVFSEKYIEVFIEFEKDLDDIRQTYEDFKDDPPIERNSPKVAGSIFWSRGLLRRIAEPMKILRDIKFVSSLRDFSRIVKVYHRLASVLIKYEEVFLSAWKSQIEAVKIGLKTPLLRLNEDREIELNSEHGILEAMTEVKWMKRLNIQVPNSAMEIFQQETRFKNYYHQLKWVMKLYHEVRGQVPKPLRQLMAPLTESIRYYLHPGLSTVTWSSLNIDAYLHQCHTAVQKLQKTVENVCNLVKEGLDDSIEKIKLLTFFDERNVSAKSWKTGEFVNDQHEFSMKISKKLAKYISGMESALQQTTGVIVQQMIATGFKSPPPTPGLFSSSPYPGSRSSSIDPMLHNKAGRNLLSPPSGLLDDAALADVKVHYCSQVYEAVLVAIRRSLHALISTIDWRHLEINRVTLHEYENLMKTNIQFDVEVQFLLPNLCTRPSLHDVQSAINKVALGIVDISRTVHWWAKDSQRTFHSSIMSDDSIKSALERISLLISGLQSHLDRILLSFRRFDFLWQDDLQFLFRAFSDGNPGLPAFHREVERLQQIQQDLVSIPDRINLGSLVLSTIPVKDCLYGFAVAWKICYAQPIHESAKNDLKTIVEKRESFRNQLTSEISSLDQLNSVLNLLQELHDLENTIDDLYLPVEITYKKLLAYDVNIARGEMEEVNTLRSKWTDLLSFAAEIQWQLMQKKRSVFEQELDKQVKTFVVEVIQFRNSFDSQGPGVPGIIPSEAVRKLKLFHDQFRQLDHRRKVLDAVQIVFGVAPTPFPELDKTGEELDMLELLYGLYQKFINFDQSFREQLWAEADLTRANQEIDSYWKDCTALPTAIRSWMAYKEMRDAIKTYIDVFPLLTKLASREIRNRHWLEVMAVTGTSFQLEANVFKLMHLLDSHLAEHKDEIEEIVQNAGKELDLEIRIRAIEEEWTEQVLNFEKFKSRGWVCLDKVNTEKLLEISEDAKASLAIMLTSKHVAPLRDEAASWAVKLKEVGEVLEQWLSVQELWQCLEEVFSNSATAKELPQESSRFARVDRTYMRTMKKAVEVRNVMQCCIGGDVPKNQMLKGLHEELEICFKSLAGYLNKKRKEFPRFYFVNDAALLNILSKPYNLDSVRPYLPAIFNGIHDIKILTKNKRGSILRKSLMPDVDEVLPQSADRKRIGNVDRVLHPIPDASDEKGAQKFGRSLTEKSSMFFEQLANCEEWKNELPQLVMIAVSDAIGEIVNLDTEVLLINGVESWLKSLFNQVTSTLENLMQQCRLDIESGMTIEDWILKYPAQVSLMNLCHIWTMECEMGISEIRIERKAMAIALRRYTNVFNKIPLIISRGAWRNSDIPLTVVHQCRLEALISIGLYFRDVFEDLGKRKLKDISDFEWQRNMRLYFVNDDEGSGKLILTLRMLDAKLDYGYEFLSCNFPVVLTQLTERCFLSLTQAVTHNSVGCLIGPTSTGKTQTIKGFSHMLGRFLISLSCLQDFAPNSIGRIFTGIAHEGAWCLFDELQQASNTTLSVVTFYIQNILNAIKSKQNCCYLLDSQQMHVLPNLSIFTNVTTSIGYKFALPGPASCLFRTVSIIKPDFHTILRTHLAAQGFKSYRMLADKIKSIEDICICQIKTSKHVLFNTGSMISVAKRAGEKRKLAQGKVNETEPEGTRIGSAFSTVNTFSSSGPKMQMKDRKLGTPVTMPAPVKMEHSIVIQSLVECFGSRLSQEEQVIFSSIVKDVFSHVLDRSITSSNKEELEIEAMLNKVITEKGLIGHQPWVSKTIQMFQLSSVFHGIIVCGNGGSGKTSCIENLIEALNEHAASRQLAGSSKMRLHKLERINVLAASDIDLMFGHVKPSGDWIDGVFTSIWKRSNKSHSVTATTTWICFDGPVQNAWCKNLKSVLDQGKYLVLPNTERLPITGKIKIMFETSSLEDADPAIVSRMGLVYMDDKILGWRPLADAWLAGRPTQHVHILQRAFRKLIDPVLTFMEQEAKPCMRLSENVMFSSCLSLLSSLLQEHTDLGGDLHVERLFIFSLIWTFGGLLTREQDQKSFSQLLLAVSTALPDYDHYVSVFDYYVDDSGEWDNWEARLLEMTYADSLDLLDDVFVETVDTMRARFLMELVSSVDKNILLVGPRGCGKTCMINDFYCNKNDKNTLVKRVAYSAGTTAADLQRFMESVVYHRQGFVYGAEDNKKMILFCDDLNVATTRVKGNDFESANELLRQLLDSKMIFNLQKPFDRRFIEGLSITASLSADQGSAENMALSDRLLRHFYIIQMPQQSEDTVHTIVSAMLEANMCANQSAGLQQELQDQIINASCSLLESVREVLKPSPISGRRNYQFSLRDLKRIFQALKHCPEEYRADDENYLPTFWQHEARRVFQDRIVQAADLNWFEETIKVIAKEHFPSLPANSQNSLFATFAVDTHLVAQRSMTQISRGMQRKIAHQPLNNMAEVTGCLQAFLTRYNEQFNKTLPVILYDQSLKHLIRIHRILTFKASGNALLIGSIGTHISSLVELVLYMINTPLHPIDCANKSSFFDGLRSAVRTAGCEGKQVAVLLSEKDLRDKSYLDAIDNILTNGSCPLLFTEEELRSLLSALVPAIKKEHSRFLSDPVAFFEIRVKLNLHIILCMQPRNTIFRNLARDYPGILSACHINWMMDWPSDALYGELSKYIEKHSLLDDINPHIIENVIRTMSGIHSRILKECNQIPWAGDYEESVSKEEEMNLPYSKNILLHRIMHKDISWTGEQKIGIFVGPTTFHRFMHCFHYVFNAKTVEINEKVLRRKKALNALVQARENVANLKEMITKLKAELGGTVKETSELLNNLVAKATLRERLKAKFDKGSGTLKAFMELIDSEMEDDLADSVLLDDHDELDEEYERIKETQQLLSKSKTLHELLKDAEKEVEEKKSELEKSSEMVNMLQKKIDRGTIERLRAFQSPPTMVGMTMVMLMILVGRPEFASYVVSSPSKGERKQEAFSDEASRISSGTSRRKRDHKNLNQQMGLTPDGRTVDKNTWKTIQVIMNDSVKFSEHINSLKWDRGISDETLKTVVSFFAPGEETARGSKISHSTGPNARSLVTPKTQNSEKKQQGVTLAAARYSSEDAAQVVEYIQAVIDFSKKSKPYHKAKETLKELKIEREKMEKKSQERTLMLSQEVPFEQPVYVDPIEGFTEDDLTRLDKEIEELRQHFDEIAIKKFNLHQKLSEYSEKLKNLTGLLDSLKPVEAVWKYFLDQNSAVDILLTNSICASAFLTYCGPLGIDQRKRMSEFFLSICKENGVPTESKKLFKDVSLAKFLVGKQMLQMWKAMSFPADIISLDNICIMTQKDCCNAWALLCDPQRVAVHWIEKLLQDTIVVKYKELSGELESCLTEGRTLLLSDVDLDSLVENEQLNSLLRNKSTFIRANAPFKLMIGEEEIECSPSFRLFIITSSPAHLVPTSIAAYTNVIEFSQSRDGLAEQFLYRFIKLEKQRIHGTLYQVEQEIVTYMVAQERAEEQLLCNLCNSDNPLSNFASIKQVSGIKRFYDEAQESLTKARNAELSIMNSRETYRSIAVCAAVLFDVSRSMSIIKPLYQISFNQFVSVFDASIKHSDRNAVSAVVAKLQYNSFISRARGLFEEDRLLFALLVALEIEDANNRLEIGEREFLISPPFGAAIKQLSNPNWEIPPKTLAKKPFDWLMDEQYHNLQLLAQYYPWFLDTFEKMSKDGRETQWRQISEHDRPEMLALPDNLDDKFLPIHRLLVIRAVRSDRLIQASSVFITMALGRRYAAQISVDLLSLARQSTPKSPILLLYRKESEICESLLANFASANQINLQTIQLCGMNGEEKYVKKAIKKIMTSGDWLVLLDGQNCLSLLDSLESFLHELKSVDSNFRVWISCNDEASFPSSLLQSSTMAVIESPKMNLKSSVCHNLQSVDSDVWKRFTRNEWLPLLHNVCMLHSTLKIRHRYGFVGLRLPYEFDFGIKHLWASLNFLTNEFKDAQISNPEGSTPSTPVSNFNQRGIQWHGLRYLLSEIVYGNSISNELDASVLASMVDLWISSSASRRDFEIPRTKYKLPPTCFIPGSKQSAVTQVIEAISDNRLEMPEMCGLYTSDETPLSDDQYTFTRLNFILDCMPSSNTLIHVPPTSSTLAGTSVPLVSSSGAFHAVGAGLLSLFNSSVFASASLTALRTSAKTDLFEISSTALDKLPRLWSRVFVNERIRKLGGPSPFNLFLLSEIDCFYQLHQELRSSLQAIKLATSEESFGDKLPEEYLKDAEELYHLRIPERFRYLAGNSSPPSSWALPAWLSDLQARFNHMEKILYQGKEKIPAYWLAAFFNPKRVLAVVMQESIRQYQIHNVVTEQFVFRTEITGRDKDHLREPSPDGMFIYGLYLWGCSWEKTIGELQDAPPKSGPSLLPVVHITAIPYSEKASLIDPQKSQFAYECPCYTSRTSPPQPIFFVDIEHKEVTSTKWPLRGICCTLRPF